jgi:hypothetical protein
MEGLLARLERRIGRFAIHNLITYVVGVMVLVFVLELLKRGYTSYLTLDPALVRQGQYWRIVSWLFIPPPGHPLLLIFVLQMYWIIGRSLEEAWGAFKLNVYYFLGMLGTTAAALLLGQPMSNTYINLSLFLAFATVFPDYEIYLFFLLPMRVKWLGLVSGAFLAYAVVTGTMSSRIAIAAAIANYLLFFGKRLFELARGIKTVARQTPRRAQLAKEREPERRPARKCAICGLSDDDEGADLRVCACKEVCGGKATVYCLPHARSHNQPN